MELVGRRTYLAVALLIIVTLAKLYNIGVDQLDPKFVDTVQTLLAGGVAWFLRSAVAGK